MRRLREASPTARPRLVSPAARLRLTWAALLSAPLLALALADAALVPTGLLWDWLAPRTDHAEPLQVEAAIRRASPGQHAVVVIGSSLAFHDVDERRLDRPPALNLGVNASTLAGTAMLLPRIVALEPRFVVLVVGRLGLARPPRIGEEVRFYDPAVAARVFADGSLPLEDRLEGLAGWSSALLRHRPALRRWWLHQGERPGDARVTQKRIAQRRFRTWLEELRREKAPLAGGGPNLEALDLIAEELQRHRIVLVVAPAPEHPAIVPGNYDPATLALLEREARRLGFVLVAPDRLGSYADADFVDPVHLGPRARARYSRVVTGELQSLGLPPRALR